MFCKRCGAVLRQNATFCHNCGLTLGVPICEPSAPPPLDEETKCRITLASLKQVFSSPLYLMVVLLTAVTAVLTVCSLAFFKDGVYSFDAFIGTFPDVSYYGVIDYVRYAFAGINILYLLSVVFMVALRFFVYNSAANYNNETVSSKALGALKWGYFIRVFCDFLPVLMYVAGLFTPIARAGISQGTFDISGLFDMVIGFGVSVVFTIFICKTISGAKSTSLTGIPNSKVSIFLVVLLFLNVYFNIVDFDLLTITTGGFADVNWLSVALSFFSAVNNLFLALVLLKYRKAMKKIENKN